jgi:ankyrin repeat protein
MSRRTIHEAARAGDLARVKRIVASDPRAVDAEDRYRWRPLFHAALRRRRAVVRFLLEHGADVSARDGFALHFAGEVPANKPVVRMLLDHGALSSYARPRSAAHREFLEAVFLGDARRAASILRKSPKLARQRDGRGYTALHRAAQHGDVPVMRLLIDHGADVNALSRNGQNVLYCAAGHGHLSAVRLLLARGADPAVKMADGNTALEWLLANGRNRSSYRPIIALLRRQV